MKSRKAELLNRNEKHKIQESMWGEIDNLSLELDATSQTDDLGEVLRSRENRYRSTDFDTGIFKNPCNS